MESGKWKVESGKLVEYATAGMDNQLFVSKYLLELPQKRTTRSIHLKRNGIMEMNNVKNGGGGAWEVVRLGDICSIIGGGTPNRSIPEYWNGNIPWVTVKDFISKRIKSTQESITEIGIKESATNIIKKGNILIPTRMALGKIAICDIDVTINQDIKALLIKDDRLVDVNYLCYFYESQASNIESQGKGATVKGITLDVLNDLQIPLPPLPVQKRIAEILDAADALRRKDQELLQKYDELAQAIFLDMFGDPVKNEKGWEVKRLGEILLEGEKISYGVVQPGDDFPNGIPIVRVGDFKLMKIDKTNLKKINPDIEKAYNRTRLNGDEVLIACVGSIGKIALADESLRGYNIVRATAKVRVCENLINRTYLAFYLSQKSIQNYFMAETRTSSQPTLNIKQIEETKILVPPISIQQKFNLLSIDISKQMGLLNDANSNSLFQTLLQKAFKSEE